MPQQRIPIRTNGQLTQEFVLEAGNEAYIRSSQNTDALVAENKRLSNDPAGLSKHGTAIAARIPVIYHYVIWPDEFEKKHGYNPRRPPLSKREEAGPAWAKFIKGKLNDPDFRHFRTDGGRRL